MIFDMNVIKENMTKKEFLNSNYTMDFCPKMFNLNMCEDYCCTEDCDVCWENSIQDVKFKGDK